MNRRLRRQLGRISNSHHKGLMENATFCQISEGRWSVVSASNPSHSYIVERNTDEEFLEDEMNRGCYECDDDNLYCTPCGICYHSYSCTCPDYEDNENICKHIHRIRISAGPSSSGNQSSNSNSGAPVTSTSLSDNDSDLDVVQVLSTCNSSGNDHNNSQSFWMELQWAKLVKQHHEKSVAAQVKTVRLTGPEVIWFVPSFIAGNSSTYCVEYKQGWDCFQCKMRDRCPTCRVCIHSYSCTCEEHKSEFPICEHIHKIAFSNQ